MKSRVGFNLFMNDVARNRNRRAEKEKKIAMLRGSEKLLAMGGFFREVIEEELEEIYPYKVIELALQYGDLEKGFWTVADEVEKAFYEMEDYEMTEEGEPVELWDEEFGKWYIEQTARVAAQRAKNDHPVFWSDWILSSEARRKLQNMPAFDQYILFLQNGPDGTEQRDAKMIAELPEFEGKEEYIEKMFGRIGSVQEELKQAYELNRNVKENA